MKSLHKTTFSSFVFTEDIDHEKRKKNVACGGITKKKDVCL